MSARLRALFAVAAILLVSGCSTAPGADQATPDGGFVAGDGSIVVLPVDERVPAPDVQGTTLDGEQFRLADHLGTPVVLNVWASWCAPCRAEAPTLAAMAAELEGQVQFVGLDTRDSDDPARSFVKRFSVPYPNVIDRDGQLQLLFGESLPPQAIPSTVVIDAQGRVAARALGRVSEPSLRGMIEMAQDGTGTTS